MIINQIKNKWMTYLLITVGTFFMAVATRIIFEPLAMITGGFSGIGIMLKAITEKAFGWWIPVGVVTFLLNVPLFILAVKWKGRGFMAKTLYAATIFSVLLTAIPTFAIVEEDYLMAAVLGGALQGIGIGMVFSQSASTGGSDLLSTLLGKKITRLTTSEWLIFVDGVIVLLGMGLFGIHNGLYAVVAVFIMGKVSDAIVDGLKYAKMVYIIAEKPADISHEIMVNMKRGVTAIEGKGMYSGSQKEVLMCVVTKKEMIRLLAIVKSADRNAFVVVIDAKEVLGEGFFLFD